MKPTKGKAGKKLYVHHTIEIGSVIVHGCFCFINILKIYTFSKISTGRLCDWGILLVISLEFQGKKHQPLSMTHPRDKTTTTSMTEPENTMLSHHSIIHQSHLTVKPNKMKNPG